MFAYAEKCGITSLLQRPFQTLSGGETQLVAIAKALVQDTEIMVLDEPTAALDLKNQEKVLRLIQELQAMGKTILLTAHNPDFAFILNSKVCMLKEGRVCCAGSANQCITPETLRQVYGVEASVFEHQGRKCVALAMG